MPAMCKKKSKEELTSFWENAHINVLTLYKRDKFGLFEKINYVKHTASARK